MISDVEYIVGAMFTAFILGYSVSYQLLIFKKAAEISS